MNPWSIDLAAMRLGGPMIVPRQLAPLGRMLPYRRAAGERPSRVGSAEIAGNSGWSATLGERGLGDVLLALGLAQALADGTTQDNDVQYRGPHSRLMQRCQLPLTTSYAAGPSVIHTRGSAGIEFRAIPESPPAWLDLLDDERVEIHAALPMRYYLAAEQALGVRLPAERAPLPMFRSSERLRPFHVVFVSATSWPGRKDYGARGFHRVATMLAKRVPAAWTFTLMTGTDAQVPVLDGVDVMAGLPAEDCLDVFAAAEVVIGNDTGLTHLAALTQRPDGTSPQVIGLYGRHAYNKWTTGTAHHHAIATSFSQMLAVADRCPVRDRLDDVLWSESACLAGIPAEVIATFACQIAGW